MFGRYELPAWRRGLGLILVVAFVWGFYGYMTTNHWPHDNGSNTSPGWIDAYPGSSYLPTPS
jgi:hypothetical protein